MRKNCVVHESVHIVREDHGRILFAFAVCVCVHVWSARTQIPQFALHGRQHCYTGWYGRSSISGLNLELNAV